MKNITHQWKQHGEDTWRDCTEDAFINYYEPHPSYVTRKFNPEPMTDDPTIAERIVKWQEQRGLIKTPDDFDIELELTNLLEEIVEIANPELESSIARGNAVMILDKLGISAKGHKPIFDHNTIDGLCDLKVYATGGIRKLGYNPDIAMEETLKQIESRTGSIVDGKYVKDTSPEAKAREYQADYSKAKIK